MHELQEKERKSKPQLEKKPSQNIDYPDELFKGRSGINDQRLLKGLYKAFLTHFEGGQTQEIVDFLHNTLSHLKIIFEGRLSLMQTSQMTS